jgi:hypothetical protein
MIRWIWSRMMKWGWDFNRSLGFDDIHVARKKRGSRDVIAVFEEDHSGNIDLPDPIVFKVQAVNGGTLVETRWYDHKKDESRVKLHIVTQEENLAESIGKIVTMELLQK